MRAEAIIRRLVAPCNNKVHATRMQALVSACAAVVACGRLNLSSLGRTIRGQASPKHGIKRVDRLLSNPHLQSERWILWSTIASRIVGTVARPVIVLDWDQGHRRFLRDHGGGGSGWAGVAGLCGKSYGKMAQVTGRCFCDFFETSRWSCRSGRVQFWWADSQFQGPFLRAVRNQGWDYVVRIRGRIRLRALDGGFHGLNRKLFPLANREGPGVGPASQPRPPRRARHPSTHSRQATPSQEALVVESPSLWHSDDGYQGGQGTVAARDLPRYRRAACGEHRQDLCDPHADRRDVPR